MKIYSLYRLKEQTIKYTHQDERPVSGPVDTVHISSGKEEKEYAFSGVISRGLRKIVNYTKARETTGADTEGASPLQASMSGAFTGFMAGGHPVNGLGGAVGGYIGIKVGEKTESITKALAASFTSGALTNVTAVTGLVLAKALIRGASTSFSPVPLAIIASCGGLAGMSGLMQGSCMGDVKDAGAVGMILGAGMSAISGNPFLSVSGSLAGAAGSILENKTAKYLTSAGVGASLGAVSGALGGPVGVAVNTVLGAVTGVISTAVGPKFGQIQRNVMEDIQKFISGKLKNATQKLGITGKTAVGILGGCISGIPMALLFSAIAGPVGAAVAVILGGAITGYKVNKVLRERK